MKISDNVYQQLMSQAADKMTELYDKVKRQDEEIAHLRAQLAEARDGLEKIAYLEDCNISGSEYRIGVADGCRTSATIARRYLDELNKVITA